MMTIERTTINDMVLLKLKCSCGEEIFSSEGRCAGRYKGFSGMTCLICGNSVNDTEGVTEGRLIAFTRGDTR